MYWGRRSDRLPVLLLNGRDDLERDPYGCAECGREPLEGERFRGYLTIDDEVAIFCPECAERKFGNVELDERAP